MSNPLPADDVLRACGYLEAVWNENLSEQAALLDHRPGETPTAVLVTQLGNDILQQLLSAHHGIHDDLPPHELQIAAAAMRSDPTVRIARVLTETLTTLAPAATAEQTETIARALLSCLLTITSATPDDVPALLTTLRDAALRRLTDPPA
ncbi:hypothetical protein [Streptomyces sp. NBC_01497]|uniref:hypothetical protein n=1 Tax=Streptomyces sp. NBC_01497 TaxID=2903885 RepID=UPI002E35299E|nr:hypothetical protein [Streptomyces sp. NBC_01497]